MFSFIVNTLVWSVSLDQPKSPFKVSHLRQSRGSPRSLLSIYALVPPVTPASTKLQPISLFDTLILYIRSSSNWPRPLDTVLLCRRSLDIGASRLSQPLGTLALLTVSSTRLHHITMQSPLSLPLPTSQNEPMAMAFIQVLNGIHSTLADQFSKQVQGMQAETRSMFFELNSKLDAILRILSCSPNVDEGYASHESSPPANSVGRTQIVSLSSPLSL